MKKSMLFVMVTMILSLFAVTPARAVEPLGALVLAGITVGGPAVVAAWNDGKLPGPPPTCKTELVKADGGGYSYSIVSKDNPSNCML